jgi:hypothetical protein
MVNPTLETSALKSLCIYLFFGALTTNISWEIAFTGTKT